MAFDDPHGTRGPREGATRVGAGVGTGVGGGAGAEGGRGRGRGLGGFGGFGDSSATETKAAPKTTEFVAFVVVLIAILVAAAIVDDNDGAGFNASQAWLYVTILTFGYMISRGLAKSGSKEPYRRDD